MIADPHKRAARTVKLRKAQQRASGEGVGLPVPRRRSPEEEARLNALVEEFRASPPPVSAAPRTRVVRADPLVGGDSSDLAKTHGEDRRCATCSCKVSKYTPRGDDGSSYCNGHLVAADQAYAVHQSEARGAAAVVARRRAGESEAQRKAHLRRVLSEAA